MKAHNTRKFVDTDIFKDFYSERAIMGPVLVNHLQTDHKADQSADHKFFEHMFQTILRQKKYVQRKLNFFLS